MNSTDTNNTAANTAVAIAAAPIVETKKFVMPTSELKTRAGETIHEGSSIVDTLSFKEKELKFLNAVLAEYGRIYVTREEAVAVNLSKFGGRSCPNYFNKNLQCLTNIRGLYRLPLEVLDENLVKTAVENTDRLIREALLEEAERKQKAEARKAEAAAKRAAEVEAAKQKAAAAKAAEEAAQPVETQPEATAEPAPTKKSKKSKKSEKVTEPVAEQPAETQPTEQPEGEEQTLTAPEQQ